MKTLIEIQTLLDQKIPRSAVMQREGGGGRSLSYLAGHYVIGRLNEIFGNLGWASDVKRLEVVHQGTVERFGKTTHTVHYMALVRLVVQGPDGAATEHTDVGYGDGSDKDNPGKAHELAMKEAITDAIKRCAKNLGGSVGLYLYDKDQANVEEDAPAEAAPKQESKPKPAANQAAPVGNDKELVMQEIQGYAKILVAKGLKTIPKIKEEMKDKFGTDVKEDLNQSQALQFRDELKQQASV